ncbi:hypothetical protein [Flagellimonas sp. CMM7]|uniref:hypothetical protein n=1 Tax=Flagellimonas sp. CMM7 TaxID=2654676 RepID=UPI0013D8496C|nr:hypothetical protein [Flagellimonas sp. CMM7]UII78408.1 hypothetical protein LV704_12085 [Flagellimonas sp. CMM7]
MKNIFNLIDKLLLFTFLLAVGLASGQKKEGFIPPSIDDAHDIPVVKEELPVPEEGENYVVKYFKGITDGTESRIAIKKLGYILRPAMVQVLTEEGKRLDVKIVKKNWEDIQREGTTQNGEFNSSFKTAMEFGIIVSAAQKGIPFIVSVSAGRELFPRSNLFVDIGSKENIEQPKNTDNAISETDKSKNGSNLLVYIIIGLAIIIILLVLILFKKRNGKALILILMLATVSQVYAGRVSRVRSIGAILQDKQLHNIARGIAGKLTQALGKQYGNQQSGRGLDLLGPDDIDHEPNMDPAGQPSLPSSCTAIAQNSENTGNGDAKDPSMNSDKKNPDNHQTGEFNTESEGFNGQRNSSTNNSSEGGTKLVSSTNHEISDDKIDNPFTGESSQSSQPRLPKYDENGQLKNPGDYPDAPQQYDPNWQPEPENPFTGESSQSSQPRLPKYDENGQLKNPGDYPDAPQQYDPNWQPEPENPFTGESSQSSQPRLPKYDENGQLKNPGDYPQAPKQIDPERVDDTDYIMEQIRLNIDDKGQPKESQGADSPPDENKPPRRNNNGGPQTSPGTSPGSKDNSPGCQCLAKAYADLHNDRYTIEKLLKIGQHTKKVTDFGISFGDNFSGVHAVSGLAWQTERAKVIKSIEKFDRTYGNKYNELIKKSYGTLLKIDHCEKLLGEEDWYSKYGFIYYEFMKARYASYK